MSDQGIDWPGEIFLELRQQKVRQVAYVPDAGHKRLLELCGEAEEMQLVPLATEEEGIALLAGAWLGGERGVLLMQSSGTGNCINMLSLARTCRFPLLTFITMRGEWGEFNPWQVPMGRMTEQVLELADVMTFRAGAPGEVRAMARGAAAMAFEGPAQAAVLLSQQLIGAKSFSNGDEIGSQPGR